MAYTTTDTVKLLLDGVEHLLRGSEANLAAQVTLAEDWVNAYLEAAGVAVPFGTAPGYLAQATANYTCYLVVRRVNTGGQFMDMMREFKSEAEKFVRDYVSGLADVPGDDLNRDDMGLPMVVNPHATGA